MGMFDSVFVKCPKCDNKETIEVQTKIGECVLAEHEWDKLEDPLIAQGISGQIAKCPKCNCYFELLIEVVVTERELRILSEEEVKDIEEDQKLHDYSSRRWGHIW